MKSHQTLLAMEKAQEFIIKYQPKSDQEKALIQLGLQASRQIINGEKYTDSYSNLILELPDSFDLITIPRDELLKFAKQAKYSKFSWVSDVTKYNFAKTLAGLALSYANEDDLEMVATLYSIVARCEFTHQWLFYLQQYLLNQQEPDGSFGIFVTPHSRDEIKKSTKLVSLSFTILVLTAFSEAPELLILHQ